MKKLLAIGFAGMLVSGCATESYVTSKIDPLNERLAKVEQAMGNLQGQMAKLLATGNPEVALAHDQVAPKPEGGAAVVAPSLVGLPTGTSPSAIDTVPEAVKAAQRAEAAAVKAAVEATESGLAATRAKDAADSALQAADRADKAASKAAKAFELQQRK